MQNLEEVANDACVNREHKAIQRPGELLSAMKCLAGRNIRSVVEIGTCRGGSLKCWASIAAPDATIVGVDVPSSSPKLDERLSSWLTSNQRGKIFRGNSRDPVFCDSVMQYLGRPIDFLFLDGAHHKRAVKMDYAIWSPHVAPGGLIGFHDVVPNPKRPTYYVPVLWNRLVRKVSWKSVIELRDPRYIGYGIGIEEKLGEKI